MLKTCSTSSALLTSSGAYEPANAIVGAAEAGSEWRNATRLPDSPLP